MSVYGNLQRNKKSHELREVLRKDKSDKEKGGKKKESKGDSEKSTDNKLSANAQRRLKNVKAKERLRHLLEKKRISTAVEMPVISKNLIHRPADNFSDDWLNGKNLINNGIIIYGIAEGAVGTVKDFDAILDALKNDTFLSREFNQGKELRSYKLGKNGKPKYTGGGRGNIDPDDVAKAAKKFKLNAKLIKGAKVFGSGLTLLGIAMTAIEAYKKGEITVLECMDILAGIMAFVPGYGWIISGTWSIMRLTIPEKGTFGIEMDNGIRRHGEW